MTNRIMDIRNLTTGKDYTVTGDGWEAIQRAGLASKYTIVRERVLSERAKVTYLPEEIKAAVANLPAAQREENTGGATPRRRRSQ